MTPRHILLLAAASDLRISPILGPVEITPATPGGSTVTHPTDKDPETKGGLELAIQSWEAASQDWSPES